MTNPVDLHGIKFLPVGMEEALQEVAKHIPLRKGDYFCFANIHVVMECHRDNELKIILNNSAANFPDGMGVAWTLKFLGNNFKDRVRGADFMLGLCSYAANRNHKIFFYGNTPETLDKLKKKLTSLFPNINIVGAISPPFRILTKEEDDAYVKQINDSGADILFISLGAPKQEKWMADHKGRIKAVQLGVGAAFSFITGKVKESPVWMQKVGLEWLHRLPQEPIKTIYRMSLVPEFIIRTLFQAIKNLSPQ